MLMDSLRSTRGMAVAPHALASQSALAVLRENGNALEAMIAAAATIAVVYRRMNSIGGDAFWLMHVLADVHGTYAAGAIDACGAAARAASIEWYRERGIPTIAPCYRSVKAINEGAGASRGASTSSFTGPDGDVIHAVRARSHGAACLRGSRVRRPTVHAGRASVMAGVYKDYAQRFLSPVYIDEVDISAYVKARAA